MIDLLLLLARMMLSEGFLNSRCMCAYKYTLVHTYVFVCVCMCAMHVCAGLLTHACACGGQLWTLSFFLNNFQIFFLKSAESH